MKKLHISLTDEEINGHRLVALLLHTEKPLKRYAVKLNFDDDAKTYKGAIEEDVLEFLCSKK